jgi:hypothetical protein
MKLATNLLTAILMFMLLIAVLGLLSVPLAIVVWLMGVR